jgi:hypothetical protein
MVSGLGYSIISKLIWVPLKQYEQMEENFDKQHEYSFFIFVTKHFFNRHIINIPEKYARSVAVPSPFHILL